MTEIPEGEIIDPTTTKGAEMHTTTNLPTGQLKRFNIRIVTSGETAIQTTIARNSQQAWNVAFDMAERLLGDKPPRSISVMPVGVRTGILQA